MNVKIMYFILLLLATPVALTIFFGFSWIQYREARHSHQTNPNAVSARNLKLWKILLIVSGVLFGMVLLAEVVVIGMMCMAVVLS